MHTQTLYTYALVAFASSVLAAPVGTSGTLAPASVSKKLEAREPFVVYGKSFEENTSASFEKERRVDGYVLFFILFLSVSIFEFVNEGHG